MHPSFKIDGKPIDLNDLTEVAYSYIKEGEPFQESIGSFLLDWISLEESITVKTSGSTGAPKIISLSKEHMKNSAIATGAFFELSSGNSCLLCLSCDYIAGKMMMVRALVLGLDIHITEPSSEPLKNPLKPKKFDFCAMVPMQVQDSLNEINRIDKLIIGGAPISNTLKQNLLQKHVKSYETYGMTETITHVAVKEITAVLEQPFKALPNVRFSLDHRGCLVIEAPNVAIQKIVTNDLVALLSEREFHWLGRYDNVINSGGVKLIPEEIEQKLFSVLDKPFIIAGVNDERLGQKLVLVIESDTSVNPELSNLNSLKILEPYERPKDIIYLTAFIRTKTGKIQRSLTIKKAINNL